MIYGYLVLEKEVTGHGQNWWDEYYETTEYSSKETKLFKSIEERDQSVDEAKKKYSKELISEDVSIVFFNTEGNLE